MQILIVLALLLPSIVLGTGLWPLGFNPQQQLESENQIIEEMNEELVTKSNIQMPGVIPHEVKFKKFYLNFCNF